MMKTKGWSPTKYLTSVAVESFPRGPKGAHTCSVINLSRELHYNKNTILLHTHLKKKDAQCHPGQVKKGVSQTLRKGSYSIAPEGNVRHMSPSGSLEHPGRQVTFRGLMVGDSNDAGNAFKPVLTGPAHKGNKHRTLTFQSH